jgi:hypothetical protein
MIWSTSTEVTNFPSSLYLIPTTDKLILILIHTITSTLFHCMARECLFRTSILGIRSHDWLIINELERDSKCSWPIWYTTLSLDWRVWESPKEDNQCSNVWGCDILITKQEFYRTCIESRAIDT